MARAARKKRLTTGKVDRLDDIIEDIRDSLEDQGEKVPYELRQWLDKFNRVGNSTQSMLRALVT